MCLTVQKEYPKPENGAIRYKVVKPHSVSGYISVWQLKRYRLGKTYSKDKRIKKIDAKGFHVFVSFNDACYDRTHGEVIIKCECNDFIAGGTAHTVTSEIWRKIKIIGEAYSDIGGS